MHKNKKIGEQVKELRVGDRVRIKNNRLDEPISGVVEEKKDRVDEEELYVAIVELDNPVDNVRTGEKSERAELHANWRDIPEDADNSDVPYTGLLLTPFNDTSPPITELEIVK